MAYKNFIFQDSKGNQYEYDTCGSENGYPVLYMHGAIPMPFSKGLLDIAEKYNLYLIAIQRPGYGASSRLKYKNIYEYAGMLKELISSLQLKNFDVMGLSAGSPYCYALAAAYPQLVKGVNICSGIPLVNVKEIYRMNARQEKFLFFLSRHLPASIIGKYGVKAIEAQERKKGWKDTVDGESMDDIFQKYVYPNWYGLGQSTNLQYKNWGFAADSISNHFYIHHSRDDEMIPFEIARKSTGLLKNCELFEYEGEEHSSERPLKDAIINIGERASRLHLL